MQIRKQKARTLKYDDSPTSEAYVSWGKTVIPLSCFYRELARFVDAGLEYWHAMDCTRDLVIHLDRDGETYILGKVSE